MPFPGHFPEEPASKHYVAGSRSFLARARRILKDGDAFAVYDALGDIGADEEGLYFHDTRHLSRYRLRLDARRPLLLNSVVTDDGTALSVDLSNPVVRSGSDGGRRPHCLLHARRSALLIGPIAWDRVVIRNFARQSLSFEVEVTFEADFHDIFEVRGETRKARGRKRLEVLSATEVELIYDGLDGVVRRTTIAFSPPPQALAADKAVWRVELQPGRRAQIVSQIACHVGQTPSPDRDDLARRYRQARRKTRQKAHDVVDVSSSQPLFDQFLRRAAYDLSMLEVPTTHGPYPYAGVPWFDAVFGRDALVTSMLILWRRPEVAKAVLQVLAETQACEHDERHGAEPGKILHEMRRGEMARTGEVPFRCYYGAVDTTPLFLILAGMYLDRTGDRETLRGLWPNLRAALNWIDQYGDADGDGLVEYSGQPDEGLRNQGWRDSADGLFHEDGTLAQGPIALCEVQGYVVAAKRHAARLAKALGHGDLAVRLAEEAQTASERIEEVFWVEDLGSYAVALDGDKRPCRVRSSNAGHLLFTGAIRPERAARTVAMLTGPRFFTGWGVRTIGRGQARYNPMSYHNGSVWPHDNALVGLGFVRYGFKREAARLLNGLFDAATYLEARRLPELFCGFRRRPGRGPTAYPTACAPQAWASAAPLGLLAACLGLEIDAPADRVTFNAPVLPEGVDEVVLHDLKVNGSRLTLRCQRRDEQVAIAVVRRTGETTVLQTL